MSTSIILYSNLRQMHLDEVTIPDVTKANTYAVRSWCSRGIQEPPIPENDTPTCKREVIAAHDIVKQCCRPIVIEDGQHIK